MPNQTVQIRAARLVDGISTSAKTDQAILVTDGRIDAVGSQEEIAKQTPPDAQIVDLGDACLAPGLIDGHTHLSLAGDGRNYIQMFSETDEMMVLTGALNLQHHLAAGITTLREHGARNMVGFTLKEGLERGYIPGPRTLVSGRPITCTGGHFHMCNETADGEAEMRRSVRPLGSRRRRLHQDYGIRWWDCRNDSGTRQLLCRRIARCRPRGAPFPSTHGSTLPSERVHGARG